MPTPKYYTMLEKKILDGGMNIKNIVAVIREHDEAKQLLHDAGFGVSGTPLLERVKQAIEKVREIESQL